MSFRCLCDFGQMPPPPPQRKSVGWFPHSRFGASAWTHLANGEGRCAALRGPGAEQSGGSGGTASQGKGRECGEGQAGRGRAQGGG